MKHRVQSEGMRHATRTNLNGGCRLFFEDEHGFGCQSLAAKAAEFNVFVVGVGSSLGGRLGKKGMRILCSTARVKKAT